MTGIETGALRSPSTKVTSARPVDPTSTSTSPHAPLGWMTIPSERDCVAAKESIRRGWVPMFVTSMIMFTVPLSLR